MRFFRKPPSRRPGPARGHHPWDPPEGAFPGIVPISTLRCGQSGQAAIAVTALSAYAEGFEITATGLIRPGASRLDTDAVPGAGPGAVPGAGPGAGPLAAPGRGPARPADRLLDRHAFEISLLLSDGRRVDSGRAQGDEEPAGPILRLRGGEGSQHHLVLRWWAWPLPPPGPLAFIARWPAYGIAETRVSIDAQVILDAAERSFRLWPESGA